ncbi:MAG: DoxX family membrane protein [Candidatus Electrothrix sp. AR4]|nr:DoxX family membrane protein [Candidatus Electrothrix sp. AR4]
MSAAAVLRRIYQSVRVVISGLFLYSGWNKLFDLHSFTLVINDYGLVPENFVFSVAIALIVGEIILAFGLLLDLRGSLSGITLFLMLFIAVLIYGIHLGLDVDCGCFGPDDARHDAQGLHQALYRDLVILVGIIYLYWYRYRFSVALRDLQFIRLLLKVQTKEKKHECR